MEFILFITGVGSSVLMVEVLIYAFVNLYAFISKD